MTMHKLDDATESDYDVAAMDREHAGQISRSNVQFGASLEQLQNVRA